MTTAWRIDIRLGHAGDSAPLRSAIIEADTEVEALRQVLTEAEHDSLAAGELLQDGQEEVFSRTEVRDGHAEHLADT